MTWTGNTSDDPVVAIQAWIVANETIAARHNAELVEQVVHDHLVDFCERLAEENSGQCVNCS